MVLLVFVYNLPQLFPVTQPLLGVPFIAGLVSMTVTEAAYMAEIHRGGLLSVAKGQSEAGHALSFSFIGIQRLIVIPQAFRISLPTLINEYITIIKLSSILSVVSLPELLLTGQRLYAQNFLVMETLLAVAVYYVMVVTVFTAVPGAGKSSRYSAQASANPQRGGMPGAAPEPAGADGGDQNAGRQRRAASARSAGHPQITGSA